MANRMKSMGTSYETAVVTWLKGHGWGWAHRRTLKGNADEGDVSLSERIPFTIEAKTQRGASTRSTLGAWIKELESEVEASGDDAGALIIKRRGTTDVGEHLAVMPVKYLNYLLKGTFNGDLKASLDPAAPAKRRRSIPRYQATDSVL